MRPLTNAADDMYVDESRKSPFKSYFEVRIHMSICPCILHE